MFDALVPSVLQEISFYRALYFNETRTLNLREKERLQVFVNKAKKCLDLGHIE
jgi:hypothetical protein